MPTIGVAVQLIAFRLQFQFSLQPSSHTSRRCAVGSFRFRGELLHVCPWKSISVFSHSAWVTLCITTRDAPPILFPEFKIDIPVL